jgi:uncharacterized protein with von Willebrand factor type A (vWA) domain
LASACQLSTDPLRITRQLMGERMFPLTLDGLDRGMKLLSKAH